jgi:hypothetical protein
MGTGALGFMDKISVCIEFNNTYSIGHVMKVEEMSKAMRECASDLLKVGP